MTDIITLTVTDHIADIRLNRPDKHNALSLELFDALTATAQSLTERDDIRAVVLSGEGPSYCAGLDLANLNTSPEFLALFKAGSPSFPNRFQSPAYLWREVPVPVISAIHGVCFGGGIQLALASDIRVATADAKMSIREINWGLIPDMSGSQTLRDLVPVDVAKELTYTGRIFSGDEAKQMGLVTHIAEDPRAKAMQIAQDIAQFSPDAISMSKFLLNESWQVSQEQGLRIEERLQSHLIDRANNKEAVTAGMAKRPANFSPRSTPSFEQLKTELGL